VEKVLQGLAFLGGLGVEGEGAETNDYQILLLQFFNTPGNEIAPGSDIIGEEVKLQGRHRVPPSRNGQDGGAQAFAFIYKDDWPRGNGT
jgi:hypothetical protein